MEQTYTKEQVIDIINELLQRPDMLMDAVENDHTDYDAETLLDIALHDIELG